MNCEKMWGEMNTDVFIKNGIRFQRMDFPFFFFFFRLHSSVREVHSFGLFWVSFWEEEEEGVDFPGVWEDFPGVCRGERISLTFWTIIICVSPSGLSL